MSLETSVKYVCIRSNTTIREMAVEVGMTENGFRKSIKDGKLAFDKIEQLAINHSLQASELIALGEEEWKQKK